MPIKIRCPHCNKAVRAPDDNAGGTSAKCPACGQLMTIPSSAPLSAPSVAPAEKTTNRKFPRWILIVAGVLILCVIVLAFNKQHKYPQVTTVTTFPDAFRRLELRGYSHTKDENALGEDIVVYKREGVNATFSAVLTKWHGQDRIQEISFSCYTDGDGFKSDTREWWDEMKQDCYALVNCREDYHRAVGDLHPIEEKDMPVLRHEGEATTADGWRIKIIEDVRTYKPQYKNPDKYWARVGDIIVTHLDTQNHIPASALQDYNRWMADESKKADERRKHELDDDKGE
jgi:phage FluMu protein Com